jgi:hypothetical protein
MNVSVSGAQLASIHSADENAFVYRLATSTLDLTKTCVNMWMGGTNTQQFDWRWSDGTKWDHATWSRGQPDNYKDKEHCLQMYNAHGCHRKASER